MNYRAKGVFARDAKIMDDTLKNDRNQKQKWNQKYEKLKDFEENKFTVEGIHNQSQFDQFIAKNKFIEPEIKPSNTKHDFSEEVNEYLLKLGIKEDKASTQLKPIGMYEPENDLKSLLYKGVSREHEGRYQYLKERRKQAPEKRFPFPMTSAMDVGWRLYDENSKLQCNFYKEAKKVDESTSYKSTAIGEFPSVYGIRNVMITSFSRENGCLSDNYKDDIIKCRIN